MTGAFATEVDAVLLIADGVLRPMNVGFRAAFLALVVVGTGLFAWVLPEPPSLVVRASFAGIGMDDVVMPPFGALVVDVSVPATDASPSVSGLPVEPEMVV